MKTYRIRKSVRIEAPKEAVWDVLLAPGCFAEWAKAFSPGTQMKADWKLGGSVCFTDKEGYGLAGKVTAFEPGKKITLEYEGELFDFRLDPTMEFQHNWKGCKETYKLEEKHGATTFSLDSEVPTKEFYDEFNKAWETVLLKIKKLAEKQKACASR